MTNVAADHDAATPSARLLGITAQHDRRRCARHVSDAIPEARTLSSPGRAAYELAHAVSSRQGFTACPDPGAIALRAVSVHYGHHRKRRTESGARASAGGRRERTGKQFHQATGYRTRIRADLSFGACSPESRQAQGAVTLLRDAADLPRLHSSIASRAGTRPQALTAYNKIIGDSYLLLHQVIL